MVHASKSDIAKLRRFAKIVRENRKLSTAFYNSLMKCETLPKYIMKHITYYYRNFRSGGTTCECKWPQNKKCNLDEYQDNQFKPLPAGAGGFGIVKLHNDDMYAVKFFIVKKDYDDNKPFITYLENRLPIVFDILKDQNVFLEVVKLNDSQLAYKMVKLESIPTRKLPWDKPVICNILITMLNIIFLKIEDMHKKGIIHCDMKLDNTMFLKIKDEQKYNYETKLSELLNVMRDHLKIIDYDGCILINDENNNVINQIKERYEYHPTTPAFAHPYLFELLYDVGKVEGFDTRLETVEASRVFYGGFFDKRLNHVEYHSYIFDVTGHNIYSSYDRMFPLELNEVNQEKLINILKFCDYYNMAMSLLAKYIAYESNFGCEKQILDLLKKKVSELKITNSNGGGSVPPSKHIGGTKGEVDGEVKPIPKLEKGQYLTYDIGGSVHVTNIFSDSSDGSDSQSVQQYNINEDTELNTLLESSK